ncbi:glycosyltransferase family 4 protein [Marinobacter hydrocarbonoclasticus]|nr:glycosyltransferase family 4 protein [Marinobacter nauticus]
MAPTKVLIWALIRPDKIGSFEDYLIALHDEARRRGLSLVVCALHPFCGELVRRLDGPHCVLERLPESATRSPIPLIQSLLRHRPDLVHTHFIGPASLSFPIIRWLFRARLVVTDHSSDQPGPDASRSQVRALKRRAVSRSVDLYLPVSDYVAARLRRLLPGCEHKIKRLYNGIDTRRFRPLSEATNRQQWIEAHFDLPGDKHWLLFVGQLAPEKGIDLCFPVVLELLERFPNWCFVIVGDGPLRRTLKLTIAQSPLRERIFLLGRRNDVDNLLRASTLFLAPSTWGEAFGLMLAEASASATAVMANRTGGIPEVVKDGITGALIPPDQPEQLKPALTRLMESPPLRETLGNQGREHVITMFEMRRMVQITFEHYERLTPPHPGPRSGVPQEEQ